MNFKKALTLILAAQMLVGSFAACSKDPATETNVPVGEIGTNTPAVTETNAPETNAPETAAPETDPPETKLDRKTVSDNLPEITFDGADFKFIVEARDVYQVYSEDDSGVGLDAEIYARNKRVEERFDVKINYFDSVIKSQDKMVIYCQADAHVADVCAFPQEMGNTPLVYGCWTNWLDLPNMNFDQPWWNRESIDNMTINGYLHNISGDLSLSSMAMTWCMAVNNDLMEDWGYSAETLNNLVWNGEWTLDKMIEITAEAWVDEDGNGEKDDGDRFGFGTQMYSEINPTFGDGVEYYGTSYLPWVTAIGEHSFVVNEEKTALVNVFGTEKVYAALEKMMNFYHNSVGTKLDAIDKDFAEGYVGMYTTKFHLFYLYSGNVDFTTGVLPFPKYDTTQDKYITSPDIIFTMFGLPSTLPVEDYQKVGVIMEALNAESWKTVMPAYYDEALKGRYSTDAEMAKMVELIANTRVYEYAPLCIQFMPDYLKLPVTFNWLIRDKVTDLASILAEGHDRIEEGLAGLFVFYGITREDGVGEEYAGGFSDFDGGKDEIE